MGKKREISDNVVDVTSYYPSSILQLGLEPESESLRGKFLNEYIRIYEDRLEAKRTGNKVVDVTSCYPSSIMLQFGLEPESLRGKFLNNLDDIL